MSSEQSVAPRVSGADKRGRPLTVGNVGADAPFLMTTTGLAGSVSPEARA